MIDAKKRITSVILANARLLEEAVCSANSKVTEATAILFSIIFFKKPF
jgi:hypothetical protein